MTNKADESELLDHLYEMLASVVSPEEIRLIMSDLFTLTQTKEAAVRLEIANLLINRASAQTIMSRLRVSSKTVTQVRNQLYKGAGYKLARRRREDWLISRWR